MEKYWDYICNENVYLSASRELEGLGLRVQGFGFKVQGLDLETSLRS